MPVSIPSVVVTSDTDLELSSSWLQAGRWQQWRPAAAAAVTSKSSVVKEMQVSPTDNCLQAR